MNSSAAVSATLFVLGMFLVSTMLGAVVTRDDHDRVDGRSAAHPRSELCLDPFCRD